MLRRGLRRFILPSCLALVIAGCTSELQKLGQNLPAEWGICQGDLIFSLVRIEDGRYGYHPCGELSSGSGKLIWKDRCGNLQNILLFYDVDTCQVPGRTGWWSIKPCIQVSKKEQIIFLDMEPSRHLTSYIGPIMVVPVEPLTASFVKRSLPTW